MNNAESNQPKISHKDCIYNILQNNRIFDTFYSHVSLIQPKGKFSFSSREVLEDFWFHYQRCIKESNVKLGLAEVPQEYIPVLIDIDLKFKLDVEPVYSDDFVQIIIKCYQKILKKLIQPTADQNMDVLLRCAFFNKKPYKVNKEQSYWKNGFHLQFFNLFLSKYDLEARIIPLVIEELAAVPDGYKLIPDIINTTDFLDRKAIGNTWLLYGSSKSEDMDSYTLSTVYDANLQTIPLEKAFLDSPIYDANEERIQIDESTYELYLPRIFSIISAGRRTCDVEKIGCSKRINNINVNIDKKLKTNRTREQVRDETALARELVSILSKKRAVGHNDWMMIGWALFNITEESDEGLAIWIKFSLQTDDHDEARCIYEWSRMQNKQSITLGTLKYFARLDNIAAYTELMSKVYAAKRINVSEKGLAELFAKHCQGDYVYCKKTWYEFKGHYWEEVDEAINLKKKILETLVPLLKKVRQQQQDMSRRDADNDDDISHEKKDKIAAVISKLETVTFLNCVVEACKLSFHDQNFDKKLDKDAYLIGFENGVYDLKENIFRRGYPSDLIVNHMQIEYKEFTDTDDQVLEVLQFFERVFPNPNIRRYFMDIMSEIFVGYNHRKHVYFLTGGGDNGKSMTQKFFEKMLGPLSIKVPTTILTSKKPAVGAATEELARSGGGVRTMWLEEPDPDEELRQGLLKQLSGNDAFYSRGLYKNGKEIEPMFKMFIVCNTLPKFEHGGDDATWNRARVIKFESTFTTNPPPTPEEQLLAKKFPRDNTLDQRIPKLSQALAWILLEHRKLPRIDDPIEVTASTAEYREENDIYAQFLSICYIPKQGSSAGVTESLEYFREFIKEYMNRVNAKIPPQKEFVKLMSKLLGPLDDSTYSWPNFKVRTYRLLGVSDTDDDDEISARTLMS